MQKIHVMLVSFVLFFLTGNGQGQRQRPASWGQSVEFDASSDVGVWKKFHEEEKWPDKIAKMEVKDGYLMLEPKTSAWFRDLQAPFLYQLVAGDFDVTMRMRVTGLAKSIPETNWSLAGLMVRAPKKTTSESWRPREENWLFLTTGVAEEPGKMVTESKFTANSSSSLKLRDGKDGWITLRLVRVGFTYVFLYKYDEDTTWTVRDRFYHVDLPYEVQVGFTAYTNALSVDPAIYWNEPKTFNNTVFTSGKPDLRLTVDYFRFKKPAINFDGDPRSQWLNQVSKNNLMDYSLTNSALIQLIGE